MKPPVHVAGLFPFRMKPVVVLGPKEIECQGVRWYARRRLNRWYGRLPRAPKWAYQWTRKVDGREVVLDCFDRAPDVDELFPTPHNVWQEMERRMLKPRGMRPSNLARGSSRDLGDVR
ncbi:MAG: hypothetical protein M5U26_22930 [Planctomycetota bacterium]|nr:hypothetical protein [Planctomycetota bacterium]